MPIALLLQELAQTLTRGSESLNPWVRLVEMEEVLIDRARSAFLVHWFGPGLPLIRSSLQVHIANLEDLRKRYDEVLRQQRAERWGMNLITPLSGAAGALGESRIGAVLNPVVLIGGGIWALRKPSTDTRSLGEKILGALCSIGTLLLQLVLLPANMVGGIAAGVQHGGAGRQEDEHVHGVPERGLTQLLDYFAIGSVLPDFLNAATDFIQQLTGDRDKVRNPLLRAVLRVGDLLAGLMSQLIGFAAVLVDEIAPLIVPLVEQGIAFSKLFGAVNEMVGFLLEDLSRSLTYAFSRLGGIFATIKSAFFGLISDALTETGYVFTYLIESLSGRLKSAVNGLGKLVTDRYTWARSQIKNNPVVLSLTSIPARLAIAGNSLNQIWKEYSAKPSGLISRGVKAVFKTGWDEAVDAYQVYRFINPSTSPPEPKWPGGPKPGALADYLGRPQRSLSELGDVPELAYWQQYGLDRLSPAWRQSGLGDPLALEASLRDQIRVDPILTAADSAATFFSEQAGRQGNPASALNAARAKDLDYRNYFSGVIGKLMPAEARVHLGDLLGLFHTLDRNIYGLSENRAAKKDFPVLLLKDNGELYPRLGQVTFVVPEGTDEALVTAFKGELLKQLQQQSYPAPGVP